MTQKYHCTMPEECKPRKEYYNRYVRYVINILLENSVDIRYEGVNIDARYSMVVDGHKVTIDYSDHPTLESSLLDCEAYFKFHCRNHHIQTENVHPFAPTSFYDWKQYRKLRGQITYKCNSDIVLNAQKPYGHATERRTHVRDMLCAKYESSKNYIYLPDYAQECYWKLINNCLVHVFVPGCYNNMLDRGHIQYLAFGCCTIAPPIVDLLPYDTKLVPGTHYIECNADYSDVIEKVEWCKKHRKECREIGYNAQELFDKSCTPGQLWQWILSKVEK